MNKKKIVKTQMRINGVVCDVEYAAKVRKKPKKKLETSKIVLFAVMLTYFIGLFYGIRVVDIILLTYPEWAIQALLGLLSYIGAPISVSIAFYSWKAKNENMKKIEKYDSQDE